MKTRQKVKLPTLTTLDEVEIMVGEIAVLTINQIKITAAMDAQLSAVRTRYESNLADIAVQLRETREILCSWSQAHPEAFPKGRKSIQFTQGTIGFRTGTPTVSLLNRTWTWKKVLAAIKQFGLDMFVRQAPEIDKDAILAANRNAQDPAGHAEGVLKPIGVKIIKDESFFVDPTLTEVETRQTQEVA